MSFSGEFQNSIDVKGRLSIPSELRDTLLDRFKDEHLVLTKGLDGGLQAIPASRWEEISQEFRKRPNSPQKILMQRFTFAPAKVCAFDKQGRIQIPQTFRDFACMEKDIILLGVDDRIEIWNKATYDKIMDDTREKLDIDYVSTLGLG